MARTDNYLIQAQQAKACVGYLPEQPPLYPEMTVQEYLDFASELKGVRRAERKEQVRRAARRTGLEEVLPRVIRSLSKGYRQRVGIAQALLGAPQLIILDEPAAGLNDTETMELAALIRRIRDTMGCTILLVEHDMGLVMNICQTVCAISFGKLLAIGTPEEIQRDPQVQNAYLGESDEEVQA